MLRRSWKHLIFVLFQIGIQDQEVAVALERQFILVGFKENWAVNMDVIQARTLDIIISQISKGN